MYCGCVVLLIQHAALVTLCVCGCACMCVRVCVYVYVGGCSCMYVCVYVCEEGGRRRDVSYVRTTDVTKPPGPVLV